FCGSTPIQCSVLIPPRGPLGRPPRAGSTAPSSYLNGPYPEICVITGAKHASRMISTRNARERITVGFRKIFFRATDPGENVSPASGRPNSSAWFERDAVTSELSFRVQKPELRVVDVPGACGVGKCSADVRAN